MATYEKHKKDPQSGARYYITAVEVKGRTVYKGFITRAGMPRWRREARTRGEVETMMREKLDELAREGAEAVRLTQGDKQDAARAKKLLDEELGEGETLEGALRELLLVRAVLGKGRDLANALDEIETARNELGGRVTLAAAASYWKSRNPDGNGVTMGEARNAFMVEAERSGVHSYTSRLGSRLERFAEWLGKGNMKKGDRRAVVSVEAGEMEAFLEDHRKQCKAGNVGQPGKDGKARAVPFSDATWNKWVVTFKHFFGWSTRKYKLPFDPSSGLGKRKVKKSGENEFLAVGEVEAVLRAAERVAPEYVPAVALLFFAGLRPAELVGKYENEGRALPGLDWRSVDRDGQIVVEAQTVKTRQRRTVPMEKNLLAWIDAYAPGERKGPVVRNPTAWTKARNAIVEASGVALPKDVARHCYATYHFGKYADRARLEANMGHVQGSGVLEGNYKSMVTAKEAARYWGLMPTTATEGGKKKRARARA